MDEYEKWLMGHIDTCSADDKDTGRRAMLKMALHEYRSFKAKADEPLAVLADRKGYWKVGFVSSCYAMAEHYWTCNIQKTSFNIRVDKQRDYDFVAPTYAAAEKAARDWLNKLEDRK